MAGMELPLLSPPTGGELQPVPVVKPENEGFQHIAEAGGNLQHDALNLWYMNRMARQDEQQAALSRSSDQMEADDYALRTRMMKENTPAGDMPAVYKAGLQAAAQKDLARYPDGPLKDRVAGMWAGRAEAGGQKMLYEATATGILQSDAAVKQSLKDKADQIPFMPPDAQARMMTQGLSDIRNYVQNKHLPPEAEGQMVDEFHARVNLSVLQKAVSDAPGHALGELTSQDFDTKHPWLGLVGGEKMRQALINQAKSSITNSDAVATAAFKEQQAKDWNTLTAMKNAGQPIPSSMLDNIHTMSAAAKEYFSPSYRPQPPGDAGALSTLMSQVPHITDSVDGIALKMRGIGVLNPNQSKTLNDAIDAQVKESGTAVGQAKSAALRDIADRYNPLPKGPYDMTSSRRAFNAEIARRARQDFLDMSTGITDPAKMIELRDKIYERYDKHNEKQQQIKAAKPPAVPPTAAAGMSDSDLVAKLGLH